MFCNSYIFLYNMILCFYGYGVYVFHIEQGPFKLPKWFYDFLSSVIPKSLPGTKLVIISDLKLTTRSNATLCELVDLLFSLLFFLSRMYGILGFGVFKYLFVTLFWTRLKSRRGNILRTFFIHENNYMCKFWLTGLAVSVVSIISESISVIF